MQLSIVTTLYESAPGLGAFYARAKKAAAAIAPRHEIIFVNDGSPDESLDIALDLCRRDLAVKVVDLSRNFGHHKAILTGLAHARGDLVFLIDCDLEEEPEVLPAFVEKLEATGADVVFGVQKARKGGLFERLSGALFYALFNALSHTAIPRNLLTVRLMTRRYVDALLDHRDREVYLPGLLAVTGYRQEPLEVRKLSRGTTTYTLARKLSMMVDAVASFSSRPLVGIFYLGAAILLASGGAGAVVLARKVLFDDTLLGWPSLIISIWLLGGLTIFCQGIVGIYLAKVFSEAKRRPRTIVRQVYEGPQAWNSGSPPHIVLPFLSGARPPAPVLRVNGSSLGAHSKEAP